MRLRPVSAGPGPVVSAHDYRVTVYRPGVFRSAPKVRVVFPAGVDRAGAARTALRAAGTALQQAPSWIRRTGAWSEYERSGRWIVEIAL